MLRERHEHLTQAILAKRVKIDVRTLRKLEKGKSETSWATVVSLASALSVTLEYFAELHDAFVREELAGACFSPPLAGGSPQVEKRFLVEATSTRNEGLITELPARDARDAKDRAIHEFMCEGHGILPSTVSAIAAQGEGS